MPSLGSRLSYIIAFQDLRFTYRVATLVNYKALSPGRQMMYDSRDPREGILLSLESIAIWLLAVVVIKYCIVLLK